MNDYIERSVVLETIRRIVENANEVYPLTQEEKELADVVVREVEKIPGYDGKPEVHAHWESAFGDKYKDRCSACGAFRAVSDVAGDPMGEKTSCFCSWCGAKMDGKDEMKARADNGCVVG